MLTSGEVLLGGLVEAVVVDRQQRGGRADAPEPPVTGAAECRLRSGGAAVTGGHIGQFLEAFPQIAHEGSSTSSASPSLAASA